MNLKLHRNKKTNATVPIIRNSCYDQVAYEYCHKKRWCYIANIILILIYFICVIN